MSPAPIRLALALALVVGCNQRSTPSADSSRDLGNRIREAGPDRPPADRPRADGPSTALPEAVRACAILAACAPTSDGTSQCLADLMRGVGWSPAVVSCLARTTGCGGLKTCIGSWVAEGAPCAAGMTGGQCDGTTAVNCNGSLGVHLDCAAVFLGTCLVTSNGAATCKRTGCSGSGTMCNGDKVVQCSEGTEVLAEFCGLGGWICRGGKCVGPGDPCTATSCQGSSLVACVAGYGLTVDCPSLGAGFGCASNPYGTFRCTQASECDQDTGKGSEVCVGDSLQVCYGGKLVTLDCKALGFSGCASKSCKL
jgi:hypothetical protein